MVTMGTAPDTAKCDLTLNGKPRNCCHLDLPVNDHPELWQGFLLADLRLHNTACGIERVVNTQSAQHVEETKFRAGRFCRIATDQKN